MFYGFDMGGTKIEMGVFDDNLKRVWQKRVATPKDDYNALLDTFKRLTDEADQHFNCLGKVGVGIPGLIDRDTGVVFTTNVPAAKEKPLFTDLQRQLNRPIKMDNDANCFALSEAWDDEFRSYGSVLGIILGTGLGGGLVIDGKVFSGRNSTAGEIGHLRLPVDALSVLGKDIPLVRCGCGQDGCIENYLSGRGFEWLYQHFYREKLSAPIIIENYRSGQPQAVEHTERFFSLLAVCMGNLFTLFDPHLVVIGGGLSHFDEIYSELPKRLPPHLFKLAKVPRIEKARYGDAGGVRGAAFLNLME
jgi:N-acetylglucosamine kinase